MAENGTEVPGNNPGNEIIEFRNRFKNVRLFASHPRDYSPVIFSPELTRWGKDDFERGIESPQEKLNIVTSQNMKELWRGLKMPETVISDEVADQIYKFSNHKPVFIPIDKDKLSDPIITAAKDFGAESTGMLIKLVALTNIEKAIT